MALRTNEVSKGATEAAGTPLRVLLVEDSEDDALLLLRQLQRGGYEPSCERVDTPEGMKRTLAEASARGEPWEIVISDYYMPRFTAPDALTLLRGLGYDTPFIVVSGKIGEDAAVAMMRAGAQDYVTKENTARLCPAIERELREAEGRRERKRAEEELREGEKRYRAVVEQAAEGILLVDVGTKRILEANAAYQNLLGYAPEEILGLTLYDVVPYSQESMDCYVERVQEQRNYVSGERRHLRKDGSLVDVEVSAKMISYGGKEAMCVVVRDIGERKRAEEELRKSESSLSVAQRIAHLGNWEYSIREDRALWSDELYRIFGISSQEFVPTYETFIERVHPDDRRLLRQAIRKAFLGEEPGSIQYRIIRPNGEVRFVQSRYELSRDAMGKPTVLTGTVQDITERKRAEEAIAEVREAERSRIARDLHDGVLQDLSYTVQAIQITKLQAQGTELEEQLQEEVDTIRSAVQGLRAAVHNLRLADELNQPFPRLLESLVERNREMARGQQIELEVKEGFPSAPLGDAGVELLRILQEALANVRRHSEARNVLVSLRAEGNDLVAEVSDDGRGFGPNTAPGVGLRSMQERATSLGGELTIQSEPGKGTRVQLRVPMPQRV